MGTHNAWRAENNNAGAADHKNLVFLGCSISHTWRQQLRDSRMRLRDSRRWPPDTMRMLLAIAHSCTQRCDPRPRKTASNEALSALPSAQVLMI